jgi:hypothetical protein
MTMPTAAIAGPIHMPLRRNKTRRPRIKAVMRAKFSIALNDSLQGLTLVPPRKAYLEAI